MGARARGAPRRVPTQRGREPRWDRHSLGLEAQWFYSTELRMLPKDLDNLMKGPFVYTLYS